MDYVVFGIGFGATILVLGLLLRDFGPRLRFRKAWDGSDVLSAEELVAKVSWTRFCTALGSVLALAGAIFLLITLVAMILVVSDDTGLWIMSIAYALLIIIMAYWTWAYFHRFGSYGILPERAEAEPFSSQPVEHEEGEDDIVGPPSPWANEDEDVSEPEEADEEPEPPEADDELAAAETGPAGEPEVVASETAADVPDEAPGVAPEGQDTEPASPARLETPEERLAHSESPIDHGSAEGDLDLAASGPRRPGGFASRRPEPADEPTVDEEESEQPDDRNRA